MWKVRGTPLLTHLRARAYGIFFIAHFLASWPLTLAQVPTLEELAGDWTKISTLRDTPSLSNWQGSVGTNHAVVDTTAFIAPPFVGSPSMVTLRVNGEAVELDTVRWAVYAACRRSKPIVVGDLRLLVTSELRMAWNDSALLWKIQFENVPTDHADGNTRESADERHTLEFSVQAMARRRHEMGWLLSEGLPTDPSDFQTAMVFPNESGQRAMVMHADTLSEAVGGFVFVDPQPGAWAWVADEQERNRSAAVGTVELSLPSGTPVTVRLVAAMGPPASGLPGTAFEEMGLRLEGYAAHFDAHFQGARDGWDAIWHEAFTPAPPSSPLPPPSPPRTFSGHLPTLITQDSSLRRLYYMSALSLLATGRTSLSAFSHGVPGLSSFVTGFGNTCWTRPGHLAPAEIECVKPARPRETLHTPVYIGATAQFYWDTSLRVLLTALLDPAAMRRYILTMLSLEEQGFERSFGLDGMTGEPLGYEYAFNAHSVFTVIATYVRVTNDTALLGLKIGTAERGEGILTVGQRLEEVALDWRRRRVPKPGSKGRESEAGRAGPMPGGGLRTMSGSDAEGVEDREIMSWHWPGDRRRSCNTRTSESEEFAESPPPKGVLGLEGAVGTVDEDGVSRGERAPEDDEDDDGYFYIADYGPRPENFLECVPTYIHVVPALQAANVEITASLATLRSAEGNRSGAVRLEKMARRLARETVEHLYMGGGAGTWGCLYPDKEYSLVPVRHIVDFVYVSRGLALASKACAAIDKAHGLAGNSTPLIPPAIAGAMSFFFHDELRTPSWTRALSLYDELNLKVPRPHSILRPDHGITGAFDAWAALAVEALAYNDEGDWDEALEVLRSMAAATQDGPFGQAHEVTEMTQSAFKTIRGFTRFAADNGGSFGEVILRGVFAYNPPFLAPVEETKPFKGLERAIQDGGQGARGGLFATLEGLRTPWGMASLEIGGGEEESGGVQIKDLKSYT
ncbi:hypothetical protein NSK_006510 [Nannochloropsis salina CCMP1776]|uniref:Alpha-L-rhamnosidase six-hairpin glycosidase domain-containing protein n=1 Tax=Nannochloropsis salina CCMP1776 TaxID=1027361 RepID=A0A4D9CSI2_9STRA|nr:hypothetical protein NSK_006510 [Nannochloropsis salina CCMP1776]|eukprot:TFJ82181.1 hypothetical protein NSK_006510 [Nannochloropsis salina CCMP1776]